MKLIDLGIGFLQKGSKRSVTIKTNLLFSFFLKGINIFTAMAIVPITLQLLDKEKYGIWLTLSSFVSWFSLFDIGLGNGLRNKFVEAKAQNDVALGKTYVSTTFALICVIIGIVLAVFLITQFFLNWGKVFNAPAYEERELAVLVVVVFSFFCLQFIFRQTTIILLADQKSAMADLVNVAGSVLSILTILTVSHFTKHTSLLLIGTIFSVCPVIALIIAYFVMFTGRYKPFKPELSFVKFKYSKDLLGLGVQFFIAQVAALVVFSTSNIVISNLLNPGEVTVYNIAFKYFSLMTFVFQIVLNPFWSAFTDAYVVQDFSWIRRSIKKLVLIWGVFCLLALLMLVLANKVYALWVGPSVIIPYSLSVCFALYVCISNWNNIFVSFNLGASKLRLQVYLSILAGVVNIPLTIFFIKKMGLPGDVLGMILAIIPGTFISPLQYWKIINNKAKGVWNR